MAILSLDELTTPLTLEEAKASIYSTLETVGLSTTTWKPGAVVRTIIVAVAVLIAAFSQLMALIARAGFLDLSEGDWLTLKAHYDFGVDRFPATFASGPIIVNNTGGGVFHFDAGDFIAKNSSTGKTYRNTSAFDLSAGQLGLSVDVEALEAGTGSTAFPGAIDSLETVLIGVTVTNNVALVGQDAESDESLIQRCRDKPASLSPNGPREAYSFFARSAVFSDGTPVGVTRVHVSHSSSVSSVTVTVADASGLLTGTVGDTTTALGIVDSDIQNNVVPEGVTCTVQSATPVSVSVTCDVWVPTATKATDQEIISAVGNAVSALISATPIGGYIIPPATTGELYLDALKAAAESARPEIFHATISTPAADVSLAETEAPAFSGPVSCTVHRV